MSRLAARHVRGWPDLHGRSAVLRATLRARRHQTGGAAEGGAGDGSSQGLGRVIAARLARDGLTVAVNGLHDDQVDAVVTAIRSAGGTAGGFVADVTDEDQVGELVASIGVDTGTGRRAGGQRHRPADQTSRWPTPPGATTSTSSSSS